MNEENKKPDQEQDKKETKEYQDCLEKYADLVPGKDYVKGEFLLGFDEDVTPAEAEEFIEKHDTNDEIEMVKTRHKWFGYTLVEVPEGKESEYSCYFDSMKDETIVSNAEPNLILRIILPAK